MFPELILEISEMTRARRPTEFYAWVKGKCEELSATPEARSFARSGATLPKKFYDEIYPLALFADREFRARSDVLIEPNLGNDNFDARIRVGSGSTEAVVAVEITYAIDGYSEALRMEVLERQGHVSATGKVRTSGRRGSPGRVVEVEDDAVDHADVVNEYLLLVGKRLRAKATSQHGRTHVLVVAVDDGLVLRDSVDAERLFEFAEALLPQLSLDFGRIVFVGVAGRLFRSYEIPRDSAGHATSNTALSATAAS